MARRTPEAQRRLSSTRDFEDIFYSVAKERAIQLGFPLPDKEMLLEDMRTARLIENTKRNVDARFAAGEDDRMRVQERKFFIETGLSFLRIGMPKRSFAIGSHGIAIHEYGHNQAQGFLPISHDVCVLPTSFPDKVVLHLLDDRGDQLIKTINKSSLAQSQQIAGCSEVLIRSLMRLKD